MTQIGFLHYRAQTFQAFSLYASHSSLLPLQAPPYPQSFSVILPFRKHTTSKRDDDREKSGMHGGKEIHSHSSARLHPHPSLPCSLTRASAQLLPPPIPFYSSLPRHSLCPAAHTRALNLTIYHTLKRFIPRPFPFLSHNIGKRLRLHVFLVRAAAPDGQLLLDVGRLHVPGRRRVCGQSPGRGGVHVLPRHVGDVKGGDAWKEAAPAGRMCEKGAGGKGKMRKSMLLAAGLSFLMLCVLTFYL